MIYYDILNMSNNEGKETLQLENNMAVQEICRIAKNKIGELEEEENDRTKQQPGVKRIYEDIIDDVETEEDMIEFNYEQGAGKYRKVMHGKNFRRGEKRYYGNDDEDDNNLNEFDEELVQHGAGNFCKEMVLNHLQAV
ncbi:uncharacterized protein [Antedon mediterranea]|uniref:uncharacterized protein isoform X3 n=1 Tax=Antedon mediterranea TaxID=105859 RepID=UPI003AF6842E